MLKVGVTGGIGSGKTLVCSILEKLGAPVYNADSMARTLMNTDAGLRVDLLKLFGEKVYGKDGLDRAWLARVVFGDSEKLADLNALVHPVVRKDFLRWSVLQSGSAYVVEEAAILFESGADREMDLSVMVYAPEELRIARVMDRDGVERDAVLTRMGHQLHEEDMMKLADYIIYNDGSKMLLPQVIELHNKVINRK